MAWNGSKGAAPQSKSRKALKINAKYAFVFCLLGIVAIGIVAFVLHGEKKDIAAEASAEAASLIGEVVPEVAVTENIEVVETKTEEKPKRKAIPNGVLPDENGVLRWPSGARYIEDYSFRENSINPYKGQKQLFKHGSEIHIATLLEAKPGNMIISGFEYGPEFDKNFLESLKEEIEFADDDTEEERRLKEDVIAVKKDFVAAIERGEKPSQIMQEAREELIQAFQYKHNLEQQLMAIRQDPTMTEQDIVDAYDAANTMLERKGLPGFSTGVMKRRLEKLKQQELKSKGY